MMAMFKGKNSMGYKNGTIYVLATTYEDDFLWIADINRKGKPTPYSNVNTFLDNWDLVSVPNKSPEKDIRKIIKTRMSKE